MDSAKRLFICLISPLLLALPLCVSAQGKAVDICIEWKEGSPAGSVSVAHGVLKKLSIVRGRGKARDQHFLFSSSGNARLLIRLDGVNDQPGPSPTMVSVQNGSSSFSFLVRDVTGEFPLYLPAYGSVVLLAGDKRSYHDVEREIESRNLKTKAQRIAEDDETSFDAVASKVLRQTVPVWLGVGRDFRIFTLEENLPAMPQEWNVITPKYAASPVFLEAMKKAPASYSYHVGRGVGPALNTTRRLEEGTLPIIYSVQTDDDIRYTSRSFVSLEQSPLTQASVKGTDFMVADKYSFGNMFTSHQEKELKRRLDVAFDVDEETVFCFSAEAVNTGRVPRYAWFKSPRPGRTWGQVFRYDFNMGTGFSSFSENQVFCISRLNGKPLPNEEIAILLQPGEKAVFEFFVPHSPLSAQRAEALAGQSHDEKFNQCRKFWLDKLAAAAVINVPEKRINEIIRAGLLHLDLITYGKEPGGTLAPTIGVYSPIGTESAPIIQFYASMGLSDLARRSLNYFFDKQHENGFMQNFGGYMVETGAVLWTAGEYFRYTRDSAWLKQITPKLLKSCQYLLDWRNANKHDSLKGRGYGMIAGKVADPEDQFHQFMLNGYAYLGLSRVAEILSVIDKDEADRLRTEADAWKSDIRTSFFNVFALSPVVPLGDGTWCSTAPPWTEAMAPRALYLQPETFYSHGTHFVPDAMLGPLYLVFCEVLNVDEPASRMMLDYHRELFFQGNSTFSQPYYSRHNWMQARLGEVKPFLNTYYSTLAALADRETYTFWEHLYRVSAHKTHEEAWFLMETRWMLYMEEGATLKLLNTIPRKWMEDGKVIEMKGVQTYFGKLDLNVRSAVSDNYIEASIHCSSDRKPEVVVIRVPHPDGKKAVSVSGGIYDPTEETVTIRPFHGTASLRIEY